MKSYEPFHYSLGWTVCRKEKRVFDICSHGLSSYRAVRSISGASGTFHAELQMYFTLASVARKEIMVRSKKANFVRTIV